MAVVAFDARPLEPATRHWGVGEFVGAVLSRLDGQYRLIGIADRFPPPPGVRIRMWPRVRKTQRAIFEVSAWFAAHDVYWGTNHFLPQTVRRPSVVTVHDLLMLGDLDGGDPLGRRRLVSSIRRATVIATNSECTARDLGRAFPELEYKIEVVPHGFTSAGVWGDRGHALPPPPCTEPFVVMLGCHRPRKNPGFALEAVKRARDRGTSLSLIVTGNIHPAYRGLLGSVPGWVRCTGVVPRERIEQLLASAVALVFPTIYEGFGLPILEAMAAGCPVLGLDTPSNRELGGAAALLSSDAEQWAQWLCQLSRSAEFHSAVRAEGLRNVARFSWDRTAARYAGIFRRLAERA